jgi:cathepsin F
MDCDTMCDSGCGGGHVYNAFKYIIKNGGIDKEKDYPYTAKVGTCRTTKARIQPAITSLSH